MKKNRRKIFIFVLFQLLLLIAIPVSAQDKPLAVDGILDLKKWNWEHDGLAKLDGKWEFYWQELLTPADFKDNIASSAKHYLGVPRAWNKEVIAGETLAGEGFATYRLRVYTPTDQILGIKIPRIFTAYNLWVNGELLASNGKVANNQGEMVPQYLPKIKYIKPESDKLELVVQVANYRHRSGGILESLLLGTEEQISRLRANNLALELFLFGSLFIIGFYHIALYIFRTKDKSTLFFGVFSLLISFRTLLVGEIFFINLFPQFNWEIAHKIQTLAFYLGVPLVFQFLKAVFPQELSPKINRYVQYFALFFALLVLLTPAKIFTRLNPIYQLFTLAVIPYVLYVVFTACLKKREGSYLVKIGILVLVIFSLNDIIFLSIVLASSEDHLLRVLIKRGNLSSWGLLVFVFAQSLVLAKKFSKSFSKVESITEELQQLNENLEEKVKERTQALEESKIELEKAYQAVTRSEKSHRNLVQNISHDLRTPLTSVRGYVGAVLDGTVQESGQQKRYLTKVLDKVTTINEMVQQLMELSQLEARQLKLDFVELPLEQFVEIIEEKYTFDFHSSPIGFRINKSGEVLDEAGGINDICLKVDMKLLDRVFGNLLGNALAHTPIGGSIEISFALSQKKKRLIIEVSDTGSGIPREDLPHVFERFYRAGKSRNDSHKNSGLGLAITKEIVEYHGGHIWVVSELGTGTSFFFTLPIFDKTKEA